MQISRATPRVLGIAVVLVMLASSVASAGETNDRVVLAGAKPFVQQGAVDKGPASGDTTFHFHVDLSARNKEQLANSAQRVSVPNSPTYRDFLSAEQIRKRYALTSRQRAQVVQWLRNAGMSVNGGTWHYLNVTGTANGVSRAFAVPVHDFEFVGMNATYKWTQITSDPSVPREIGGFVANVYTLKNNVTIESTGSGGDEELSGVVSHQEGGPRSLPSRATEEVCSEYWGEQLATDLPQVDGHTVPYGQCGFSPGQLRRAYGFDRGLTAKGETVAIIGNPSGTLRSDVSTWSDRVGLPPLDSGQLTVMDAPPGDVTAQSTPGSGAAIEVTLDVQAVRAVAPGANIVVVPLGTSVGDLFDSVAMVLNNDLADIISISMTVIGYRARRNYAESLFQQAAVQGVGIYASTGDGGAIGYPAESPWVTGVGATSVGIGYNGERVFESGWGTRQSKLGPDGSEWTLPPQKWLTHGSSGGFRRKIPQPFYQEGVVPEVVSTTDDGAGPYRVGPDIAMPGDPMTSGLLIGGKALSKDGHSYKEMTVGGTSLSTARFAAVEALAQEASGGGSIGFANPAIYQRYRSASIRDIMRFIYPGGSVPHAIVVDQRTGNPILQFVHGEDSYAPNGRTELRTGYDNVTGLGTVTPFYLHSFK